MKEFTLLFLGGCLAALLVSGCQKPIVERAKPVVIPSLPPVDLVKLRTDPASLIEGVYVGQLFTRTPSRIGILDGGAELVVRRCSSHQIDIQSVYGQMNNYIVNLSVNGDTIKAVSGQLVTLKVLIKDNKPASFFNIEATQSIRFSEQQPDIAYFNWLQSIELRPMSNYRSTVNGQLAFPFLTGIYCGNFPSKHAGETQNYSHPVVIRQVSEREVELFDVNLWKKPYRFLLQKQPNDSIWTGTSSGMKIVFNIVGGRTQRLTVEPLVADTVQLVESWPPLNFQYDVKRPSYNSTYIQF